VTKDKEIRIFKPDKDLIRCNLCQREMLIAEYDRHYDKCLAITTLIPILRDKGQKINYKDLDEYSFESLDKLLEKYLPPIPQIKTKNNEQKYFTLIGQYYIIFLGKEMF